VIEDDLDEFDFFDHIITCMRSASLHLPFSFLRFRNPFNLNTELGLSCLSSFGGPIQPYVVLGDFNSTNDYTTARGLVITLLLNNHNDHHQNHFAEMWEAELVNATTRTLFGTAF
jgi:Niemann-Pick C1 protein